MSSYLTFYIVPKEGKPIDLISYSRSSEIYQQFNDTLNVTYIGNGDEPQYMELTIDKVDEVLNEIKEFSNKIQKRISEYEKHASGNSEIIEEIIGQKEYLEELQDAYNKIEFIKDIVREASYSWSDYNKVLCNID